MFAPISREGALVLNNLFLTAAAATVVIGTLYPLVLEALTGVRISVGAPFFNLTFGPLVVPLLLLVPFGPMLAWKRGDLDAARRTPDGGVRDAVVGRRIVAAVLRRDATACAFRRRPGASG